MKNLQKLIFVVGILLLLVGVFIFSIKFLGWLISTLFLLGIILILLSTLWWDKIYNWKKGKGSKSSYHEEIRSDNAKSNYYPPRDYPGLNSPWIRKDFLYMGYYAEELRKYIEWAPSNETTFIAIEGEWGSGKTWLIKYVLEKLPDEWVKIEFNPWLHTSPDKLKIDLINTIADEYGRATGRPLSKWSSIYRNFINSISDTKLSIIPTIDWITKLFGTSLKGSPKAGKEFGKWIKYGNKKLIVYIQDIDRCEREMILSLLRLLRESELWKGVVVLIEYDPKELKSKNIDLHKYIDVPLKYIPSSNGKINIFKKGIEILLNNSLDLSIQEIEMLKAFKSILEDPGDYFLYKNIVSIIKTSNLRIIRKVLILLPFIIRRAFNYSLSMCQLFIVEFYKILHPEIFEHFFRLLYYNEHLRAMLPDTLEILLEKSLKRREEKEILESKINKLKEEIKKEIPNSEKIINKFFQNIGFFESEVRKKEEENAFWTPYKVKLFLAPLTFPSIIQDLERFISLCKEKNIDEIAKYLNDKIKTGGLEGFIYTLRTEWDTFIKEISSVSFQNILIEILNKLRIENGDFFKLIEIFMWSIHKELPEKISNKNISEYFNKFNPLVAQIINLHWRASTFYRISETLAWKLQDFNKQLNLWQENLRKAYKFQFEYLLKDIKDKRIHLPDKNSELLESLLLLCGFSSILIKKEERIKNWITLIKKLKESTEYRYNVKAEELEKLILNWEKIRKTEEFLKFSLSLRYNNFDNIVNSLKEKIKEVKSSKKNE